MAERGQISGLDFRFNQYQPPVAQQQYAQQAPVQVDVPDYDEDPLAVREKLTSDYFNNMGLLRSFAQDMARKGVDVFEPDYSQEGGGLAFQTAKKLEASLMYAANALGNEFKAETQMRPYLAQGNTRLAPNTDTGGMYAQDPNSFRPTKLPPGVEEANIRMRQETNDPQSQARANMAITQQETSLDDQVRQGIMTQEDAEYYKQQLVPNQWRTQPFAPRSDYGNGANSGISAYVKKWSEVANGLGFEPGESFDAQGNRIDISRPSEFSGRQLGFTKDGKKFILDRFEKIVQPNGDFIVEAVDATGKNRVQVDPRNIVGSLRSFIETNEGAGALKDLNSFFRSQGFDTATDSVPANRYSDRATDVTPQTAIAPKVSQARGKINTYLDALQPGGIGSFLKNVFAASTGNYQNVKPTEVEYKTADGRSLIIKKDGDDYKIANYRDIFGNPKGGVIEINGKKTPVVGTFEKVPKATLQAMLEKFGVVNVMLKDSDGNEVANEPISTKSIKVSDIPAKAAAANRTPEEYTQLLKQRGVQIIE